MKNFTDIVCDNFKWRLASLVANVAHIKQIRKYTGEPYYNHYNHLHNVAEIVYFAELKLNKNISTPSIISAAFLHDILEDTDLSHDFLLNQFGIEIFSYVFDLTDNPVRKGINRVLRKELDRQRISKSTYEVKTIKLADLIDNMQEKKLLLDQSLKEGNKILYEIAENILNTNKTYSHQEILNMINVSHGT